MKVIMRGWTIKRVAMNCDVPGKKDHNKQQDVYGRQVSLWREPQVSTLFIS